MSTVKNIIKGAGYTASIGSVLCTLLVKEEGMSLVDYPDPAYGSSLVTTCVGHTGPGLRIGRQRTYAECQSFLSVDAKKAWDAVGDLVKVPLAPYEMVAYTSFVFNAGRGHFASSTMLKLLNAGHHTEACEQFPRWVYAGPKTLSGLVKRRGIEERICLGLPVAEIDMNKLGVE